MGARFGSRIVARGGSVMANNLQAMWLRAAIVVLIGVALALPLL